MSGESDKRRLEIRPGAGRMEALVALSRHYGGDGEFVLAGGGNTSVKVGDTLYVKASGAALLGIDEGGFVAMDRRALTALLERTLSEDVNRREEEFKAAILAARIEPEKGQRPSVECVLHNVMPGEFVAHTHSTWANMVACSKGGEQIAEEIFGDEVTWAPYVDPGYVLAKALSGALADFRRRTGRDAPEAVILENHGLIVSGDSPEEIVRRTDAIVAKIRRRLDSEIGKEPFGATRHIDAAKARVLIEIIAPALRGLLANGESLKVVTFDDSEVALALACGADGEAAAMGGPLTPDQIVYCKAMPLWFDMQEDTSPEAVVRALGRRIEEYRSAAGFAPIVVLVRGVGLFATGDDFAAADAARAVYADAAKVMAGARRLGGVGYLSKRNREFIEHWEVENYRRSLAALGTHKGRAAGKVAVVTGAAQGFGREIAEDLANEGAHVALVDINAAGVRAAAEAIGSKAAPGRVMWSAADVTSWESVSAAANKIVRRFGGFDIFVSNAGVLRAGSVKAQSQEEFEFVTSVNYVGYFVCVKCAAAIMAVQHLAKSDYSSDIIQINSKSGLAGSNRNSAYAGSKFGGIGLTESFALELVEDGIKVNAICPGNFFDGPLWSDPENGLFAQYLRSGKVPGATTISEVRRAYEAKIPMGRGCTTADVMKALYYLIEQKYETGQAVPVTGGQVMLR